MQRSGAATRRFYAAFYHWTLRSANPNRRCAGTTATTLVTRRRQSTVHDTSARSQRHSEPVGTSEQLRKEAVQSTADRPTESLNLWEHAVRNKSEKSVAVELLVPRRVLRSKDVGKKAQLHEVTLSTPGLREYASDDEPCAVVLEGGYTDVKAVWKNLYSHGAGQSSNGSTATKKTTHADVEPIAHRLRQDYAREQQQSFVEKECSLPESFWQPIGKEGTAVYLQTQFGLHVDMLDESGPLQYARLKGSERQVREVDEFLEEIRIWELEKTHQKISVNATEKQVKIVRRNDLPSENLEVWQSVTRKQLQGETEIDICLPERVWQRIIRNGGAENLHARFAMAFEPLKMSRDGKTRCITFKGDVAYADRAKSYLEGFRVNIPELQEDEEYLKIYSAATGLQMIMGRDQRQSARRSQRNIDSDKRTAQASSRKSHKRSSTASPVIPPTRGDAVSDKLREPMPAVEEEVDRTASWNTYKKVTQTPPEATIKAAEAEQQTSPEPTVKAAATEEQPPTSSDKELDTPKEGQSSTQYVWLRIAKTIALSKEIHDKKIAIGIENGCFVGKYKRVTSQEGLMQISGSKEAVRKTISVLQQFIDERRKADDKRALKVEILPATTFAAARQSMLAGINELDTPTEGSVRTHFAWLKSPRTYSVSEYNARTAAIGNKHNCLISAHRRVTEEEGAVRVIGSEEALSNAIRDLQRLSDEGCEKKGKPPVKLEIVSTGLFGDMPTIAAVRQSILTGAPVLSQDQASENVQRPAVQSVIIEAPAIGKDQTSGSIEKPAMPTSEAAYMELDRFAWIKITQDDSTFSRVHRMLAQNVAKFNSKASDPRTVSKVAGVVQSVARLQGSEETIKSAVEAMQQQLANEIRDTSGKPAVTVEIMQMGWMKDMVSFDTFIRSIRDEAPAMPAEQSPSLPQQTSTGNVVAEQAEKVPSASISVETPQPARQSAASPQQTSVESGAAEQAGKVASTSTSGRTAQHTTVDRADAPEAREAEEKPTKQSNQQLGDDMRAALRHITQPVALVTSYAPQVHLQTRPGKRTHARGVTVSSFCTVTLQPIPVVSFNLRIPSRSWDAISGSGYLRVHLLRASPEGAAIAHAFTLPYEQPHQPFEHLSQNGVTIGYSSRSRNPASVPQIISRAAIHARFVARVMPEKCIQVGDHMIVVAEVKEIEGYVSAAAKSGGALAYGMRGYRQLGDEILPMEFKPMEIKPAEQTPSETRPAKVAESVEDGPTKTVKITQQESEADHIQPGEKAPKKVESAVSVANEIAKPEGQESAVDHVQADETSPNGVATSDMVDLYARFAADPDEDFEATPAPAPKNVEDLGPSSPLLDEESLRQVLEENDAAYSSSGLPSQTAADNPALAEALSAVAGAYGDASETTVPSQPESTSQTKAPSVDQPADPAAPSQPDSTPQTEIQPVAHPAKSVAREERPANALSTGRRPWGMDDTMTQKIRKMSIYHTSPPHRHYSSKINSSSSSSSSSSSDSPPQPPLSKQLLKTTVADYLCQIPTHRKRYTNLIKLQRSAEAFEAQLQQSSHKITDEEAATLTTQAQTARRKVSRELALRNAQDLRAMLDNGRVAADAAQWLESNLEHGQVVLLDEAKILRRELEDGRLRVGDFERSKAELTRDYEVIDAQLMRLREFAEDDVYDDEGEFGEESGDGREGGRG